MSTSNDPFACIPTIGNQKTLIKFLKHCHNAEGGALVPMIYGPPGVGKTESMQAYADSIGYTLLPILLGQILPEHVAGAQFVNADHTEAVQLKSFMLARIEKLRKTSGKPVLVAFDELTVASTETTAAALEFLRERSVGGRPIPEDTLMIAAGNRPQDTSAAVLLDPPVRSRLESVQFIPSRHSFANYITKKWDESTVAGIIANFCRSSHAPKFWDQDIGDEAAFVTPRDIESAIRKTTKYIKEAKDISKPFMSMLIASSCGQQFASELVAFAALQGAVMPAKAVLADPTGTKIPNTIEVMTAQCNEMIQFIEPMSGDSRNKAIKTALNFWERCSPEHLRIWLSQTPHWLDVAIGETLRGKRFLADVMGASQGTADAARG